MNKWINITIRDNDDKNFIFVHSIKISQTEFTILKDYDSEHYDEVWDKLCDKIEKIMPYNMNWYIDNISEHK